MLNASEDWTMYQHCSGLLLAKPQSQQERIDKIVEFWQTLWKSGSPGSTSWEVLEYYYYRIWRCLGESPPDVDLAEALTAQAMFRMIGKAVF